MPETIVIPSVAEAPTLPIWSDDPSAACAGRILDYSSKAPAYRAVKQGLIPSVQLSERRFAVPTAALRTLLGLPVDGPAIVLGGDV